MTWWQVPIGKSKPHVLARLQPAEQGGRQREEQAMIFSGFPFFRPWTLFHHFSSLSSGLEGRYPGRVPPTKEYWDGCAWLSTAPNLLPETARRGRSKDNRKIDQYNIHHIFLLPRKKTLQWHYLKCALVIINVNKYLTETKIFASFCAFQN